MPETSVHVRDKNREISPLEREEGYGGKDLEKMSGHWPLCETLDRVYQLLTHMLNNCVELANWSGSGLR